MILLDDYTDSVTQITAACDVPASGLLYVSIHLDYGLKKMTGWQQVDANNPDTDWDDAYDGTVTILDGEEYSFSFSPGGDTQTPTSTNAFKKNPGVNGLTLQSVTTNPKQNVKVQLVSPTGKVVGTTTTDADGFYQILYKHTGKAANYTVKLPEYGPQQVVQLKANGFAVVVFSNLP